MSVTTESVTTESFVGATVPVATRGRTWRSTVLAGFASAAVVTAVAAAAHAAGVSLAIQGEMIPLAGFAQNTFIGAVLGGLLLAVLNRCSRAPRRRFLQATAALTVLSCVPSIAWPDDTATKSVLVALHLLAAAIIVPVLARHAHE